MKIDRTTSVAEIVKACPSARRIFDEHGLHGCGGEHGPTEALEFFARVHQVDVDELVRELNAELEHPSPLGYVFQESIADFIYRRFFKGGIAVIMTVGCVWGAVNLLQIALKQNFLQLYLLPSIHAHAHAMIFGWVGLFVMGFAYQSFPRFKNTSLWRPDLANLTFFMILTGIVARVVAELTSPSPLAMGLGAISATVEIIAVILFLTILYKTAARSIEPRNRYEKFLFASFFYFLISTVLESVFFFAKATAGGQEELVKRIALIDGPLRDLQLLGFAALIIAGVSQRFVPVVYGLAKPKHDWLNLIFAIMNISLLLNIGCYVALLSTMFYGNGNGLPLVYVAGLELAYLLMPVWAVLLSIQLGIFTRPSTPDRTFKFVRAAYVWLIAAMAMMPFFLPYGLLTHQAFSHAYMGSVRHAYTVGFISLMIVGVSSRVVPILAGVNATKLSSLWVPFVLINVGNFGRVALQLATDWIPKFAYSLVGFTGFIEVTGLAIWAWEMWRVMNASRTERVKVMSAPPPQLVTISR